MPSRTHNYQAELGWQITSHKITNSVKESCKSSVAGDEKMGNDSIEIRPQDMKELGRHSQIFSPVKRYCAELLFYVPSAADRYSSISKFGKKLRRLLILQLIALITITCNQDRSIVLYRNHL